MIIIIILIHTSVDRHSVIMIILELNMTDVQNMHYYYYFMHY